MVKERDQNDTIRDMEQDWGVEPGQLWVANDGTGQYCMIVRIVPFNTLQIESNRNTDSDPVAICLFSNCIGYEYIDIIGTYWLSEIS